MVVKPEELENISEEEKQAIKALEEKIDKELLKADPDREEYAVSMDDIDVPFRARKKIKEMYENAGWKKVVFHNEQLGGKWISIKK